jgi:plastocyanin
MLREVLYGALLAAAVFSLVPAVGAAPAASTTRVAVRDDGVQPANACVRPGAEVTWTNVGVLAHRITADQRTWAAFMLAPGGSKSVSFPGVGDHPYRMDGVPAGVINVRNACPTTPAPSDSSGSGPRGSGSGSAGRAESGTRIVTYDVEVRGTLTNKGKVLDDTGRVSEEWDRRFDWSGTWAGVRVEVVETQGLFAATSGTPAVLLVPSTVRFTEQYRWLLHPHVSGPPIADCSGNINLVLPATFSVAAHSFTGVSIVEQLTLEGADALGLSDPAKRPGCAGLLPPGPTAGPRFVIDSDMTAELSVTLFTIYLERPGGPAGAAPVDALLRGAAFQVDAGPQVSTARTCEGACSGEVVIEERYVTIFTPAR